MKNASYEAFEEEMKIFNEISQKILNNIDSIKITSNVISFIDVCSSLGYFAFENNFVRPVVDDSFNFIVKDGRHPIVEFAQQNISTFVENDCELNEQTSLYLLTG